MNIKLLLYIELNKKWFQDCHFLFCPQYLFVPWAGTKESNIVSCAQMISEIGATKTRLKIKHVKWLGGEK